MMQKPDISRSLNVMFKEIANYGWLVNNLFQVKGQWQCNLCKPMPDRNFTEYSVGKTAREAVAGALEDLKRPRNKEAHDLLEGL